MLIDIIANNISIYFQLTGSVCCQLPGNEVLLLSSSSPPGLPLLLLAGEEAEQAAEKEPEEIQQVG